MAKTEKSVTDEVVSLLRNEVDENDDLTSPRRRMLDGKRPVEIELTETVEEDAVDDSGELTKETHTIRFRELASWQMARCMESLLYLHNETGNIFSHLIGSVLFLAASFVVWRKLPEGVPTAQWSDQAVMAVFMASAVGCMGMSAFFHTVVCHSQKVCRMWNKADYVGIVLLICGSTVPVMFYGFYCDPILQMVYLSMMGVFGCVTAYMCLSHRFATPEFRYLRTANFCALGLSGVFPVGHSLYLYGLPFVSKALSLWPLLIMAAQYLIGAYIYASRVPEAWFPGKFDIWGHSHQIFHCLVFTAAVTHYFGVMSAYHFWHDGNPRCELSTLEFAKLLS
ncbi:hypothetical protein HKX48_006228 [Thoreauomyces humboldtii]|nr:hypothetical protein HKX48_006228 [Thoreauomyces humboldtii]